MAWLRQKKLGKPLLVQWRRAAFTLVFNQRKETNNQTKSETPYGIVCQHFPPVKLPKQLHTLSFRLCFIERIPSVFECLLSCRLLQLSGYGLLLA